MKLLTLLFLLCMSVPCLAQTPQAMCPSSQSSCLYNHQTANGTVTIKSGAGVLHTVTINTVGATNTITIYDNTLGSGTVIAKITDTVAGTYTFDTGFQTGLTIVIAGTTAPDVTFNYL